jgi:hypothetical protein
VLDHIECVAVYRAEQSRQAADGEQGEQFELPPEYDVAAAQPAPGGEQRSSEQGEDDPLI